MYKVLFSFLLSIILLSSATYAMFIDKDSRESEVRFVNKLSFIKNRNENEDIHLKYKQDKSLAESLRKDMEKALALPEKKHQAKKLENKLVLYQKNFKDYEAEAKDLNEKLGQDPAHQQLLKRQEHVKREIESIAAYIYDLQIQKQILEKEIGSTRESVQKQLSNILFKELQENRSQAKSIDETARCISNIPMDILEIILANTVCQSPPFFVPFFRDLWSARLVSKQFKEGADKVLKNKKFVTEALLRPADINKKAAVLSAIRSFSLQKLFLVGDWDHAFLERLHEILSGGEFSQITSLFYIRSGMRDFIASRDLGVDGAYYLSNVFKHFPNLERLNIEGLLDEEGGKYIALSLYRLPKLKWLDINSSGMGPLAVKKLAKSLQYLPLLERLDLHGSNSGDIGAQAIAKFLRYVPSLQSLDLGTPITSGPYDKSKKIYEVGFKKLAKALINHPSIKSVCIRGNATQTSTALNNLKNKNQIDISILN